ncbi:MAG: diguanylate cyclase (GGDEF)-like protein/PAS domain S-box-containing protein [Motiliproteus sp.]|jgi:diguanylate cyclase (GGDEF)-like protein/PAS domain S-box-containing protein
MNKELKRILPDVASDFANEEVRRPKVLIVDDIDANIFALKKTLAKLDCEIITASSGAAALALTLRHEFSVILLDVQMPIMNGFEVAGYLRENPATAQVPIIFVTAISTEQGHIAAGYGTGAVDYLCKPVDPAMLISKVRIFMELDVQRRKLKQMLAIISEVGHRYQVILDSASSGIAEVDEEGLITFANPAAQGLVGRSAAMAGQSLSAVFAEGDPNFGVPWEDSVLAKAMVNQERLSAGEGRMVSGSYTDFAAEYSFSPYSSSYGVGGGVFIFKDITTRKQVEDSLYRMARYDDLTGLPNRALFKDTLAKTLAKAKRRQGMFGVFFLDLDGFKAINDTFGHAAGDQLLREFAQRMNKNLRVSDLTGRLSGDEFAMIVDDADSKEEIEIVAGKIRALFAEPYATGEAQRNLTASIGVACYPSSGDSVDALLSAADQAMYRAKQKGKGCWSY